MISGRSGGSGKYSFRETHEGIKSVLVAHMPEDSFDVRIVFKTHGENSIPIIKASTTEAKLLWCSLKKMAEDLGWDDRLLSEKIEQEKVK